MKNQKKIVRLAESEREPDVNEEESNDRMNDNMEIETTSKNAREHVQFSINESEGKKKRNKNEQE